MAFPLAFPDVCELLDQAMVRQDMTQVMIMAAQLAGPEALATMTREEEGRRLREILTVIRRVMELRGHDVPVDTPSPVEPVDSEDEYVDPEQDEQQEQQQKEEEEEEEVEEEEEEEGKEEKDKGAADEDAAPADNTPMLHPGHMIKFGYEWWPVYTNAFGHYVLRVYAGKLRRVYVHNMAAATQATLKTVAALPPADTLSARKAIPTGTYLVKGGVSYAVFEGAGGAKMFFVEGQAKALGAGEPVVLQLSEHDRAALGATTEE
jgi:hypothetical protein